MKIFGYLDEGLPSALVAPAALAEITLVTTADELRRIAAFLHTCADQIEQQGAGFDHRHLHDHDPTFSDAPQLVVSAAPM